MFQATFNGDQFAFTEVNEISEEMKYWWGTMPKFETKSGYVLVYYEKGVGIDMDELWMQCQQHFE